MKKIDFLATDGLKLNGLLYESNQKTDKVILSVHGMSSNCLKNREDILSKCMNQNNIDYFCFNNRGSELVRYIQKDINGEKEKLLGGTTYEDVLEGYEDIVGAILKLRELGYKEIYLQGHSLGCTKIVYTYNELKEEEENDILDSIKGIILLSLVAQNEQKYRVITYNYGEFKHFKDQIRRRALDCHSTGAFGIYLLSENRHGILEQ